MKRKHMKQESKCNHTLYTDSPDNTWKEEPTTDPAYEGRIRVACSVCDKFYGYKLPPPVTGTAENPTQESNSKPPPLIRPDRQIIYPEAPNHYQWPEATLLHDHDTITVDRIREDIDGPSHRFIIKRGDSVEVCFAPNDFKEGIVVGISHARSEVRVIFCEGTEGIWFYKGQLYPVAEADNEPPIPPGDRRTKLSSVIEQLNAGNGSDLTESDRVPQNVEPASDTAAAASNHSNDSSLPPLESQNRRALLSPYSFDEFRTFLREHSEAPVSFERFKNEFQRIWESHDALKGELASRFKATELGHIANRLGCYGVNRSTKTKNVEAIYTKMLSSFLVDGTVSFSMGERFEDAIKKKVDSLTLEDYESALAKRQAKSQEYEKALINPETFLEFRTFLQTKSENHLTDEQLSRYDALYADVTRERRAAEFDNQVKRFQSPELQALQFKIKEGYHDKRQCSLWIVQLELRVKQVAFEELKRKAKLLGGWYSNFKRSDAGFQFLEKGIAQRFASLLTQDADRTDVMEARQERRELSASERLHELAARLANHADRVIERSNGSLQNTARRADIQAGVRGRAYANQSLARTMHSIAEALSRGEAKYLDGIRHKTHIRALDEALGLARWARVRAARKEEGENYSRSNRIRSIEEQPLGHNDVRFAQYPYPSLRKRDLEQLIENTKSTTGLKQVGARLLTRISREHGDFVTFHNEDEIETLYDFLNDANRAGFPTQSLLDAREKYRCLRQANIRDINELRAALREYLVHRAEARGDDPVKVAERELIGKRLPGFFPTPKPVIAQMLELAEISDTHAILEPSCGKGDILDELRALHPEAAIHGIELNLSLADVLSAKKHDVEFADFMSHQARYDRIVMNPPFEHSADIDHVQHAYSLLNPGGRIVSVMSEGPFFRDDKKAREFREWLDEVGAETEELPEGSFAGIEAFRGTTVRTRLVTIDK